MKFKDLKKLYLKKREKFGIKVYKHISDILNEAKKIHKRDWLKNKTPKKDHEQSWRSFKGKNFEKLIQFMITKEVENLGLKIVNGNKLERIKPEKLSEELSIVKRNVAIDYGEFGLHLPDVDIIIYRPDNFKIVAVISSKITLRERIAQTGYWKLKFLQNRATKNIKVFFITPDEDKTLTKKKPAKKGRAIVEVDLDGSYVMTKEKIEESDKVKIFEEFLNDLKKLIKKRNK